MTTYGASFLRKWISSFARRCGAKKLAMFPVKPCKTASIGCVWQSLSFNITIVGIVSYMRITYDIIHTECGSWKFSWFLHPFTVPELFSTAGHSDTYRKQRTARSLRRAFYIYRYFSIMHSKQKQYMEAEIRFFSILIQSANHFL